METTETYQILRRDIEAARQLYWPPANTLNVDGLPLYYTSNEIVIEYMEVWQPLVNRAIEYLYPLNDVDDSYHDLPSNLNIPIIYPNCSKIRINKSKAKESITFRGLASLLEKCGEFSEHDIGLMTSWLNSDDSSALVGHREFVDIRAYIYVLQQEKPIRSRFYTNGLLIGGSDGFQLFDHRDKVRKERSDAFSDPIAKNELWRIYGKYR